MKGKYYFSAAMDVPLNKEALFDEVYDKEHIPYLSDVPGVLAIARFTTEPLKMVIGGVEQEIIIENQPKHTAIYEIEDPKVLTSPEWAAAVDKGRWATEVRQHTFNRRHVLLKNKN
jgi:hypothetical protein